MWTILIILVAIQVALSVNTLARHGRIPKYRWPALTAGIIAVPVHEAGLWFEKHPRCLFLTTVAFCLAVGVQL